MSSSRGRSTPIRDSSLLLRCRIMRSPEGRTSDSLYFPDQSRKSAASLPPGAPNDSPCARKRNRSSYNFQTTGVFAAFAMLIEKTQADGILQALAVHQLYKTYRRNRRIFLWKETVEIPVLKNVSLSLPRGQILGVCGPSGSGKSTLARCIACLEPWDSGNVILEGANVDSSQPQLLRKARLRVQLVLQDSAASLNPNFSALETVREPLDILRKGNKRERYHASLTAIERVRLPTALAKRNVNALSSGQRQRLALARALIVKPAVLVLDETLSGVDVAVQAEIVNLLLDLQSEFSISYVFISHNLRLVCHLADQVIVLGTGEIVRNSSSGEQAFEGYRTWN